MKTNPHHEERVLREQLRLALGNESTAFIPTILLVSLLIWALADASNRVEMWLWGAFVIIAKTFATWDASRYLKRDLTSAQMHTLMHRLYVINIVNGASWGMLTWPTLGHVSVAGSALVFAVIAGAIVGSAMSILAPLSSVLIAFILADGAAVVAKLITLPDPGYHALALATLLYVAMLYTQVLRHARAARALIEMRFENIEMVERLRKETEIADAAKRAAEDANRAKSKFLAAASHDLRQPIHAQGLFLEVLANSPLDPKQREIVANIRAAAQGSREMLNTLLDFSRIEAGVLHPHLRPFNIGALINKIENELGPQADAKGLVYRSRDTDLVVNSDPALVELILRNLVSNAIRYTQHGGLLVGCRRHDDHVSLEVWDTGIGIPTDQQREIFREFHQLGNPERDQRKGLGLGLAIAEGLAHLLHHPLSVASKFGRGSQFRLTLPLATLALAPEPATATKPISKPIAGVRVLLIEDDEAVRTAMAGLLRAWGCECDSCESFEEAQLAIAKARPTLVISDYRLRKQMTGTEAIAAVRNACGCPLPALLITGDTAPERLTEAFASGIPLLHKPVSPDQLYRAITDLLGCAPHTDA